MEREFTVKNIKVNVIGFEDMTLPEIEKYVDYVKERTENITHLEISPDNGDVSLKITIVPQKFERIRRITGYLVGTTDRWNNAKRAEEHDRVKHSLSAE